MHTTRDIQARLTALGYDVGPIDNNYGKRTKAAVEAFQAAHPPLVVDGDAGSRTRAVLFVDQDRDTPAPTAAGAGMTTSAAGRAAISQREGVRLTAYQDSVGIWTVGVGHTVAAGPPTPRAGLTISQAECDAILSRDLAKFEATVRKSVTVAMTQNQFDACVSLAFNIGGGAFAGSSIVKRLNAGNAAGAADAFLLWNKAGGKVLAGLVTRRKAEREQFLRA